MPIYEYRCESCAGKFEVLTRFAERDHAQVCPACESTKTRVLVSSFAFASGGESSSVSDFASETSGGGCCGGACGSRGSGPNQTPTLAFSRPLPGQPPPPQGRGWRRPP